MKELVKHVLVYVASLFNAGVYLTDELDSLILKLNALKIEAYNSEVEYLHSLSTFLDVSKLAIMLFTCLSCYFINYDEINGGVKRLGQGLKRIFSSLKTKLISLFKNKK